MTSYAVQGSTFIESTSRIDENASRSETYVDITRGRSANHLYLTRSLDPLDGERLPKAPPPPIEVSVSTRLAGSGPERAAIDIDPAAPSALATTAADRFRPQDGATAEGGSGSAEAPAAERRRRQTDRLGTRRLDASVADALPPRSHLPFLARRWDETAAALHTFHVKWDLTLGGSGRWEWALGRCSHDPARAQEWREDAALLVDLVVATARESMRSHGVELPAWARPHLAHHAALGVCVHDPHRLAELYQRIEGYRRDAGVAEIEDPSSAAEAILGPAPDDAALRARRRGLADEALPGRSRLTHEGASRASA
ncbi:MAG: hypothetical protein ACT4OS_11480 [Acidimicrobiales bacterium]